MDRHAVGGHDVGFGVHLDGSAECSVDRVATQQGCPLEQVLFAVLAYDHGTQIQSRPEAALDQDASQEPADSAETVEHDVLALAFLLALEADDVGELVAQPSFDIGVIALGLVQLVEPGQIHGGRAQFEFVQRLDQRVRLLEAEFDRIDLPGPAVGLDDVCDRLVEQAAAVNVHDHAVLAVQPADQRDHGFGELFAAGPLGGGDRAGHG